LVVANVDEWAGESRLVMSLQITYCHGGMEEFERTGTYPRKILVFDQNLGKRWWRKISEEKNSGELKIGNRIIYKYSVNVDLEEISIFDQNGDLVKDCLIIIEMRD
jgi:hypothetical protein